MANTLTQPKVRRYIDRLRDRYRFGEVKDVYDEKTNILLDELFRLLKQVSPVAENGAKTLWLRAQRGPISDYGDPREAVEMGDCDNEEQLIQEWESWFPDEIAWYEMDALEDPKEGYRAVMLRHRYVITQDLRRQVEGFPFKLSEFVQWLVDGVKECIEMLRAGTYNEFIRENLPPQHRTGTIKRKDFWDVWPEARANFFKDISAEDVAEFIRLASEQPANYKEIDGRLPTMTANDFFRFCAMGYAANNYNGCDKSPKEQYYLHADGRDDGLKEIDADDPEAFHVWLNDRKLHGGHPWEVCRGGNSTHVSLAVSEDERGCFLFLAGDAWTRTIETVKFFLVLRRAGIPVFLREAKVLAQRLAETELIGIVPEGVTPAYCSSWFPGEHIIDYMNLPYEDREKFVPFCKWYDEPYVNLIDIYL